MSDRHTAMDPRDKRIKELRAGIEDRDKTIADFQAVRSEQEQELWGFGPITCRNGQQHDRMDLCVYCEIDARDTIIAELLPVINEVMQAWESSKLPFRFGSWASRSVMKLKIASQKAVRAIEGVKEE